MSDPLKAKSLTSIRREYTRVKTELAKANDGPDRDSLYGAMQALGWVIDSEMCMSPSRAFKIGYIGRSKR